jgi:dimethylhistidine N-methyltransferase
MSVATMHTFLPTLPSVVDDLDVFAFRRDVIAGLSRTPREIPGKYLYDRRGSLLYDLACELPNFYPNRAEIAIMREFAGNIISHVGTRITLIELGCGSGMKTRLLLDRLSEGSVYLPVDISREHLADTAGRLHRLYQHIEIDPICADFTRPFELPLPAWAPQQRVVYLPASTIGNFKSHEARQMLRILARLSGAGGRALIGFDLDKDPATIEAAYNDDAGVMGEFNLNLLLRINAELHGDFDVEAFSHEAVYNRQERRIEMRLVSAYSQFAWAGGRRFHFSPGESITTQYSHKFTVDGFARLAKAAGLAPIWCWFDEREYFCVMCLECEH